MSRGPLWDFIQADRLEMGIGSIWMGSVATHFSFLFFLGSLLRMNIVNVAAHLTQTQTLPTGINEPPRNISSIGGKPEHLFPISFTMLFEPPFVGNFLASHVQLPTGIYQTCHPWMGKKHRNPQPPMLANEKTAAAFGCGALCC